MSLTRQIALTFGRWNRQRKLEDLLGLAARIDARRILLVGIADDERDDGFNNLIERRVAQRFDHVVGLGLAPTGPDWLRYVQGDALDLPFERDEFDLVFSNAVIEHVGKEAEQRLFVTEHARVGRAWMLTTPNRAFPIEAHDHTFIRHWSRNWSNRSGSVTRLLTPSDLRRLLPDNAEVRGSWASPTLSARGIRP